MVLDRNDKASAMSITRVAHGKLPKHGMRSAVLFAQIGQGICIQRDRAGERARSPAADHFSGHEIDGDATLGAAASLPEDVRSIKPDEEAIPACQRVRDIVANRSKVSELHLSTRRMGFASLDPSYGAIACPGRSQ